MSGAHTYGHKPIVGGVNLHKVGLQQIFHDFYALFRVIVIAVASGLIRLLRSGAGAAMRCRGGKTPLVSDVHAEGTPRQTAHIRRLPLAYACS